MDTTADRFLKFTHMDPESFESLELPTGRPQIFPATLSSSPGHWTGRQWPPDRAITISTNQLTPTADTQLLFDPDYDQHTTCTPSSECCEPESEANGSMQASSWSQDCSSCSEEDKIMDERNGNDMGRSCGHGSYYNRCKSRDASSAILREPSAYHTRRTPLDLEMPRVSSRLPPQSTIRPSNASRCQPLAYDLPDMSVNTPPPSYSASPLLSPLSHTAFQPFPAPFPDPNECSFMNFDDSDLETCEKRESKADSVSRCFNQRREGEAKRRFRHSISEVFSALSCSR